ncbi:Gfo/Idh/MocA family oxidoreductase [Hoyosella altamirensis]|uniref:Myo-inositol 2-dehydrogenase/D-chiro-inositol 1-dehydrogenase n=1 Tax=Hoyosella altamirensis TaxID=616997 RepID=A0A839RTR7_9ACTN|nr:Gfo/Idh/MocA family oxidoreductase [Hoyosella altamirensis]MBB3039464.1 myo-inositol 2-dehydrogenase/D-chiro-inositol 1-dehydrogenase [Hoyosella altamirensis]
MGIRVGVIGLGNMGADHTRTLHRFVSGATVTRVADINAERAAEIAAEIPTASIAPDGQTLIEDPDVDAVVIASHDATHAPLTLACLEASKPVLCEKPLAPTLESAAEVVAHENGRGLISLGFMRRFDPGYVELKAGIENPLVVHTRSRGVRSGPGADSATSITGSAIHDFDTIAWLLDSPITEVSWHAGKQSSHVNGLNDPQLMLVRTEDGVLSTVETYLNARFGYDIRCEVVCETHVVRLAEPVRTVVDAARQQSTRYAPDWRPRFADAYRLQLQAWVDAVAAGEPSPLANAHDGLVASAVADAAVASMQSGGDFVHVETLRSM